MCIVRTEQAVPCDFHKHLDLFSCTLRLAFLTRGQFGEEEAVLLMAFHPESRSKDMA
jgi:hypothetical protein